MHYDIPPMRGNFAKCLSIITSKLTLKRKNSMNTIIDLSLVDPDGKKKSLKEWLSDSPYTIFALYRGDW